MSDRDFHDLNDDEFEADGEELDVFVEDDSISIVKIRGKKKFLDWVKDIHTSKNIPLEQDDEEILNYVESFHVPSFTDKESTADFFDEFGQDIFQYMFALYFRDKKSFPKYEGMRTFHDWFEVLIEGHIKSFEEILDFLDEIDGKVI
ncbi:MAG: hypothetical protein AAF518_10410 [Spirochaetota bacterium]